MKEYTVKKMVQLTFTIFAKDAQEAEDKAFSVDDRNAHDYQIYDIEIEGDEEE
jgi:hypothetical protein